MVTRIVKIGGASISDKAQYEHAKLEHIEFIVNLFKNNYKNLILIHGAGSFGHHQAKKYKLNKGYNSSDNLEECRLGLCDTRRSLGRLQQYLLDAFIRAEIPIACISPFDFLVSDKFELTDENYKHLYERLEILLANGYVPLVHGDVLIDKQTHWRILSGDDILLKLAEYFQARQCIFLTSVPGILQSNGNVIEKFYADESKIDELDDNQSSMFDVTGSMQNKVMIACNIVNKISRCQVFIVQGVSDNAKYLLSLSPINDENFILHGSTRILKKS